MQKTFVSKKIKIVLFIFVFTLNQICAQDLDKAECKLFFSDFMENQHFYLLRNSINFKINASVYDTINLKLNYLPDSLKNEFMIKLLVGAYIIRFDTSIITNATLINNDDFDKKYWINNWYPRIEEHLGQSEADSLFNNHKNALDFIWTMISANEKCYYQISAPIFSNDEKHALILVKKSFGQLHSISEIEYFIKSNNAWRMDKKLISFSDQ